MRRNPRRETMKRVALAVLVLPLLVALTTVAFATGDGRADLIAGGGNKKSAEVVGSVVVECGEARFHVQDGYCLAEIHLHVFQDAAGFTDVPHKNGNPIPGQFDYKYEFDECIQNFRVPIGTLDPGQYYIAAHAVVREAECECDCWEETAWGGCYMSWEEQFPGKNWAFYFPYMVME
jgi:hypothetical protein